MVSPSARVAWQNNNESSANIRLVIFGAPLQIDTPLILSSDSALFSKAVRPLAHNRNKYGQIGSP